jgi:hypothetical protein
MTDASDELDDAEFVRWWAETGEFELRQVLYWRWDPIGIADAFPLSAGEYDTYAFEICEALRASGGRETVVRVLGEIQRERMGLSGADDAQLNAVAGLIELWFDASPDRWRGLGPVSR